MVDKQEVDPVAIAKTTMIVVIVLVIIGGICAIAGALLAGRDYDAEIKAIRSGSSKVTHDSLRSYGPATNTERADNERGWHYATDP